MRLGPLTIFLDVLGPEPGAKYSDDHGELGADFDDCALENFQRFLNQRVVFEIVFVERHGRRFVLCRLRGSRGWFAGSARGCGGFRGRGSRGRGGGGRGCFHHGGDAIGRRFGFYKFELSVVVSQFAELGLQQRVVAGVVHQGDVIFKFRGKANR